MSNIDLDVFVNANSADKECSLTQGEKVVTVLSLFSTLLGSVLVRFQLRMESAHRTRASLDSNRVCALSTKGKKNHMYGVQRFSAYT